MNKKYLSKSEAVSRLNDGKKVYVTFSENDLHLPFEIANAILVSGIVIINSTTIYNPQSKVMNVYCYPELEPEKVSIQSDNIVNMYFYIPV